MFAAMFITIAPIAGWLGGTSGKRRMRMGRTALARMLTRPDFSASRMMPSQRAIIPASGRARFITADLQASKAPFVSSGSWPDKAPRRTAMTTRPSQIQLSMGDSR